MPSRADDWLWQALRDLDHARDTFEDRSRYPNSYPEGTPGDFYTTADAQRAIAAAERVVERRVSVRRRRVPVHASRGRADEERGKHADRLGAGRWARVGRSSGAQRERRPAHDRGALRRRLLATLGPGKSLSEIALVDGRRAPARRPAARDQGAARRSPSAPERPPPRRRRISLHSSHASPATGGCPRTGRPRRGR